MASKTIDACVMCLQSAETLDHIALSAASSVDKFGFVCCPGLA
jgi:hypothetical protein